MDVYVTEVNLFGSYLYQVWVDGKVYDTMQTYQGKRSLTYSEQNDIAEGYREALDT